MPRALSLTPRRQQVFDFIVAFKRTHDGNSPSVAEIREGCSMSSSSTVKYHLNNLVQHGLIECDYGKGKSRMITVCGGRWIPPSQDVQKVSPAFGEARVPSYSSITE